MTKHINIYDLFKLGGEIPLLDVRTPAEFEHAHIPGAYNLPIFSNEERVKVGTTYKQLGREEAILLGFDLTGPKWSGFIKQALEISPDKKVAVHCWRGGMRSGAMAWALNLYGFEVHLVEGGYKTYRRWVHRQFEEKYHIRILGGMTGSGKTDILKQLKLKGEQVIDLEDLAQHQGSSYGTMNCMVQPSQEQFENNLAAELARSDANKLLWLEDESLTIGQRSIPNALWHQMRIAPVIELITDVELRVKKLVEEYGKLDKEFLNTCTLRIAKRLGPEQTKHAIEAIAVSDMDTFIRLALVYYDKSYKVGLNRREAGSIHSLEIASVNSAANAIRIMSLSDQINTIIEN